MIRTFFASCRVLVSLCELLVIRKVHRTPISLSMASNNPSPTPRKLIILAGATSAGKSAASLALAKRIDAEIVIADSVQVYRHLDVASNKPTPEEMSQVPHHLVDVTDPENPLSAGEFCNLAMECIRDIDSRGKTPLIVGGSTMWIQWLVQGIPDAPPASERALQLAADLLREPESTKDWPAAVRILREYDPVRAEKISPNDWYRMRRYLEVAIDLRERQASATASQEASDTETAQLSGKRVPLLRDFDVRTFFLMEDRERLFHTIDQRCEVMLQRGMLQEIGELLLRGILRPEMPVWKSIGYRQAIQYLLDPRITDGNVTAFEQFLSDFAGETRRYASRQYKYYRKDSNILYLQIDRSSAATSSGPADPYEVIADEVIHWMSTEREGFDAAIQTQLRRAQWVNKWRKAKKFNIDSVSSTSFASPPSILPAFESPEELMVLSSLVEAKEVSIASRSLSADEVKVQWQQLAVTTPLPHRWSAEGFAVRAEENVKRMQTYMSHIPSPHTPTASVPSSPLYLRYVEIGDHYRKRLREEKPGLWEAFFADEAS